MPELPFTLDQLRILKAIAAQGSFKKAADLLYVTQPAVSLQTVSYTHLTLPTILLV